MLTTINFSLVFRIVTNCVALMFLKMNYNEIWEEISTFLYFKNNAKWEISSQIKDWYPLLPSSGWVFRLNFNHLVLTILGISLPPQISSPFHYQLSTHSSLPLNLYLHNCLFQSDSLSWDSVISFKIIWIITNIAYYITLTTSCGIPWFLRYTNPIVLKAW